MTAPPPAGSLENLLPSGVRQRRTMAFVALAVAVAGAITLDVLDVPSRWKALGIVPLWVAALCWLQASAKT